MNDPGPCPRCGRSLAPSRHELHAGLVSALEKLWDRVQARKVAGLPNWNDVHLRRELDLSIDQLCNFAKLKYLCLVTQKLKSGREIRGHWAISKLGVEFLAGRVKIQPVVYTFNRKIVRKEGDPVGVERFRNQPAEFGKDAPEQTGAPAFKQATLV